MYEFNIREILFRMFDQGMLANMQLTRSDAGQI